MSTERHDLNTPHGIASARAALSAVEARLDAANPNAERVKLAQCPRCARFYAPEVKVCPLHPENALEVTAFETALLNLLQSAYDLAREYVDEHRRY